MRLAAGVTTGAFAFFLASCDGDRPAPVQPTVTKPLTNAITPPNGGGQCMVDDVVTYLGQTPTNCTANDVSIAFANVTTVNGQSYNGTDAIQCTPGDQIQLGLTAVLLATSSSERGDIGIWIATDGGNARTGACNHYNLIPGTTGTTNDDSGGPPDQCAGMTAPGGNSSVQTLVPLGNLTFTCPASGPIHVGGCVAWNTPGQDGICPDDRDGNGTAGQPTDFRAATVPGSPSKCNCDGFDISVILAGKVTIVKDAVPNSAQDFAYTTSGSGLSSFSLDDDADATLSNTKVFSNLTPLVAGGSRTITETAVAGWTVTNISCTNTTGSTVVIGASGGFDAGDNSVTISNLASAADITCTFTNTATASIAIQKETVGGTASFDFTATGGGVSNTSRNTATQGNPTTVAATTLTGSDVSGDKYFQETALTGWTLTGIACTANGATIVIGRGGSGAFVNGGGNGFDAGDNTVKITPAPGSSPTCTFTNTKDASLAIQKASVGGTATFGFAGSGTDVPATFDRTTTPNNPTTAAAFAITGDHLGDKYVQETVPSGWSLTGISCTANGATIVIGRGGSGAFVNGGTDGFDDGDNTVKVTVGAGNTPTCTFTNTKSATLAIQKESVGGTATFSYTGTGAGVPASFSRNTATANPTTEAAFAITPAQLGDKYVEETIPTGWSLTGIVCTANGATFVIGRGGSGSFTNGGTDGFDAGDNTVKVSVAAGSSPTCTFTNTKDATLAIQKQTVGGTGSFSYTGTGTGVPASFTRNTATQGNPTNEAASSITAAQFGDKYVEETVPSDYALTGISCTANGATIVIGRGGSGAFVNGGGNGFDAGDNTVKVTVGAGNTPTCTFTNTKYGSIKIVKDDKNPETDAQDFAFSASGTGMTPTSFNLDDDADGTLSNQQLFSSLLPNGTRSASETAASGWVLTGISCTGATSSTIAFVGANSDPAFQAGDNQVNVGLAAGENVVCTFTNQRKARLIVQKVITGGGSQVFDFSRTGISNFTLGNGGENNSGFSLAPGTYRVCELTLAVSWAATATLTPPGGAITLINPDSPQDLGNRCYDVVVGYGDDVTIVFTNRPPPGGDARTIGYWKNWSSCTGGNQYLKAQQRGLLEKTLDFYLPNNASVFPLGDIQSLTCPQAVLLLDKSDIVSGKKMASDPAYNLAAQFFAARLNYAANAKQCSAATTAMGQAQALLDAINFTGTGAYAKSMTAQQAALANSLAAILDSYNNNTLACP